MIKFATSPLHTVRRTLLAMYNGEFPFHAITQVLCNVIH